VLLYSQGIEVSTRQAVRWTMIGIFFDLAVPSSNGGDLVKAGCVPKYDVGAGRRTQAVMAVAFDRIPGLIGLFLLAFLVSVLGWDMLRDFPARNMLAGVTFGAGVGALIFLRVARAGRLNQNQGVDAFYRGTSGGWASKIVLGRCLEREPRS
jgi:hypothetical protein